MNEDTYEELVTGRLPPWQVEDRLEALGEDRFRAAAELRRRWLEAATGVELGSLPLPDRPWRQLHRCPSDGAVYDLVAWDPRLVCDRCGSNLAPCEAAQALVASYLGGVEDFYSHAGTIEVHGDVEATFRNVIQYGTGLGPIGTARGCHFVNRLGGALVQVSEQASACRCICVTYPSADMRDRAWRVIEGSLPGLRERIEAILEPWGGALRLVEPLRTRQDNDHRLYMTFVADFTEFRGHHAISKAVGAVKLQVEESLARSGLSPRACYIAQGYDGDLKPSPRNQRGRFTRACVVAPVGAVEGVLKVSADRLVHFVRVDAQGVSRLGWFGHTGMGGEVVPACYKATKVNPHSSLVSSYESISAGVSDGLLSFAVEMPNIEGAVVSSGEGLIPPLGRALIRLIGLESARHFAAWVCSLVLAAELNPCVEIARGRLYRPES